MNDDQKEKQIEAQPTSAKQAEQPEQAKRRGIEVRVTVKPTGESESSANSEFYGEVPVLPEEATQRVITEQLLHLEDHEDESAASLKGEQDLDLVKGKARAVISETNRQAAVAGELAAFLEENETEMLLIDPTKYVEELRQIPDTGLKFLITRKAGEKFKKKFDSVFNFQRLETGSNQEAGFSVINIATGLPEYTFIYSKDK